MNKVYDSNISIQDGDLNSKLIEFQQYLILQGFIAPNRVIPDGQIHRFSTNPNDVKDTAGWYAFHISENDCCAVCGDWRSEWKTKWTPEGQIETENMKNFIYSKIKEQEKERASRQFEAMNHAQTYFSSLSLASDENPYLKKKKVKADNFIKADESTLIIPLYNENSEICSYQKINENGEKHLLSGGRKKGCFYRIGGIDSQWKESEIIYVCEGYATAKSVQEASNNDVVMAIDAGNLPACINTLKDIIPQSKKLVIVADNDESNKGETEAKKAGAEYILIPETGMDANDYASKYGIDALKEVLHSKLHTHAVFVIPDVSVLDKPVEWLVEGVFQKQCLAEIFCIRGKGKSFMAIRLMFSVLYGVPFGRHETIPANGLVYYIVGQNEGQGPAVIERLRAADIYFSEETGKPSQWNRIRVLDSQQKTLKLSNGNAFKTMKEAIMKEQTPPILIVIDTLRANINGTDSNQDDVSPFMDNVGNLVSTFNCCVVFIHHQGKRNSDATINGNDRGSSIIQDGVDVAYRIDGGVSEGTLALICDKARDFETPATMVFKPQEVIIPCENGIERSSVVIIDASEDETNNYKRSKKANNNDISTLISLLNGIFGGELQKQLSENPILTVDRKRLREQACIQKIDFKNQFCKGKTTNIQTRLEEAGVILTEYNGKNGFWIVSSKLAELGNI